MTKELIIAAIFAALAALAASEESQPAPVCEPDRCPMNECRQLPLASSVPASATVGVTMDMPPEMRTRNWGGGSCVHASTVNLLKWQGQHELAEWWRNQYSGGENDSRLVQRMEAAGLRYAYAHDDEAFLEWCIRTRRGAGIFYKPSHAINCVGMDAEYVYLLDNNAVNYPESQGHYERVPRAEFFRRWRGFGGFAWTIVYEPPPPTPYL